MVRLTIERPEQAPEVVTFDGPTELTIGRSGGCTYCLDFDPMVSRMHAVILVDPPSIRIKDLNSTNGLTINGEVFGALGNQKIIQPLELRDGDEIYVGSTRFLVNLVELEMDLGPELEKLKAEQAATAPSTRPEVMETSQDRVVSRFMAAEMAGRNLASRQMQSMDDTVANLSAICPDIPGYRVDRYLATGRTGTVYKATSLETGKNVALKVMSPGSAFTKKMLDDFRNEMEHIKRLQHSNLVRLLDAGDMGHATFYTVSEYINGENLASYLDRCPNNRIPLHTSYNLMLQLANAMCYAHKQGMVHRGIHPSGVMLFDDNGRLRAKLTDVGMATFWAESGLDARTMMTSDTGRLGYVAPEELLQLGESKPSADVFSLTAVFYQMLTSRVPYNFGEMDNAMRVVEEGRITPIESLMSDLPEPLVVIIDRGLAAEADERYQSACELLEALENVWVQ